MTQESSREAKIEACPPALQELIEEFNFAAPRERLEMLVDFSMEMPDLPERLQSQRDKMEQVHECQTPVFVFTEIEKNSEENGGDDAVHFFIDVPRESPTVRGYAAIVLEGLDGATSDQVLQTPDDVHYLLGLHEALTPQRMRGLHALVAYLKRQVTAKLA